ncbi:MAG TPA: hypothetical protein VMQ54_02170 [Steroidobacteraceae bacterium]|nr:hypothetical protein [Steroidobacteraceae bacterium]
MSTPRTPEQKALDDANTTIRQKTERIIQLEREQQTFMNAAEHFVEWFTKIKAGQPRKVVYGSLDTAPQLIKRRAYAV